MFSQKRKKYRNVVWASVLTAVAILALVILLGYLGSFRENNYSETNVNEPVTTQEQTEKADIDDRNEEFDENEDSETTRKNQTYYLLKCDNDVVCIYFSDQQGELTKLEETAIVYETLSVEDQAQLVDGIQVENRDALNRLLMDYES